MGEQTADDVDDCGDHRRHRHSDPGRPQQQRNGACQAREARRRHPAGVRMNGLDRSVQRRCRPPRRSSRPRSTSSTSRYTVASRVRSRARYVTTRSEMIGVAAMPRWQQIVPAVKAMSTSTVATPKALATRCMVSVVSPDPLRWRAGPRPSACTGRGPAARAARRAPVGRPAASAARSSDRGERLARRPAHGGPHPVDEPYGDHRSRGAVGRTAARGRRPRPDGGSRCTRHANSSSGGDVRMRRSGRCSSVVEQPPCKR